RARALRRRSGPARPAILWGIGGHLIKVGLGPVLIDLIRRGFITGIAMNGAALVHDFEIALGGHTSEEVEAGLGSGRFGMAEETGLYLNEMAVGAERGGIGLGEAAGKLLTSGRLRVKYTQASVLVGAYRARVPLTVRLAIGTDTPHMHRSADGRAVGAATHHDFRLFCGLVKQMHPGGVYLKWGSAVILPEVFLKAVSVVRNLGVALSPITTANFDFIQHYRPLQNVVRRPTAPAGKGRASDSKGYAITGHHELLLPLVAAGLLSGWPRPQSRKRAAAKPKRPRSTTARTARPRKSPDPPPRKSRSRTPLRAPGSPRPSGKPPPRRPPRLRPLRFCPPTCASPGPGSTSS